MSSEVAQRPLSISEKDWQRRVLDCARLFNWRFAHFRPARTTKGWRTALEGDRGFPDCVFVKPPRIIFAELKSDSGKATVDQVLWLEDLKSSGVESYCLRPTD